jgi:hypothetical protein
VTETFWFWRYYPPIEPEVYCFRRCANTSPPELRLKTAFLRFSVALRKGDPP